MQQQKDMYRVHSPISGVVDEALVKQGQAAAPGVPLAKIVNFSKLKVKADAAETYAPRLRVGSAVKLQFPDLQKEVNSKITYVGNGVNPMNRTIKVEIALKGNEQGILPNMLSVVRLLDYSKPNALAVPINMLQKDLAGQDFILVAENGKAVKKIVKLGQISGDKVEILSGLKAGEQLVTVGYQDLNEGDTLQVQ
jgi:RND family efflux transporter MFP subunit